MRNDRLNSADQSLDTDSRLVDLAWRQIEAIETARPASSRGEAAGAWRGHPLPADSFTGYRILREIHRGGQGVVYEAIQESTDRTVAIKVLKQGPFADSAELARFEREVHVLSRLNHPNIVTIHDRGSSAGHAYLVMDYVPGRALDQYLAGADCSQEVTLRLFGKICDAVHAAHLRGIIHRDLKPGNIRIDEGGEPHVLDFGLAKITGADADDSSAQSMTLTGQFVGSMPWASPEQALGHAHEIDLRTDVYSLGIILYQILTRRLPYPVTGPTRDVQDRILNAVPVRPSAVAPNIDSDLDTIVLKCLAKQPERRYQSAGELARDIRHFLAGEPIEARRDSFVYVLRKQLRRHRGPTAVAVALVVMIVGGLAYCAAQWQRADREAIRAKKAEQETKQRADELEKVAKFQEAQLSGIDAQTMGARLRTDLLEKARATAERSKLPQDDADARIGELEKLIAGSDFTGMAMESLKNNFFQPALAAIESQFSGQPLVQARLLQTVAFTMLKLGLLDAASGPQEQALAIRRRELGEEHSDTLASINNMGLLLQAQGKLDQAESYLIEALEKYRRMLGAEHPDTLTSLHNMGDLLRDQGKLADAERFHREALEKRRRVLGDEHPDVLTSIGSVGLLLEAEGKLAEAEPYCREALEKCRRILGEDHRDTIAAINNMGVLLHAQGKFAEAEQYWREGLDGLRRRLGDEHPDTITAIHNVGFVLQSQGKFSEAEPYCREALERARRVLGDKHRQTLNAINSIAKLLYAQGNQEEAEPYLREALETSRRILGVEHPDTLITITNLATLLYAQGKFAEAEGYFREVLEKNRRILGDEHPVTLTSINNMGGVLQAQGRLVEAEPYFREAMEKQRRLLGDEHPNTLLSINNIGSLLQAQGKLAEAEPYLREALETRRRALGDEHPQSLTSITSMGRLLCAQGKPLEAIGLLAPAEPAARRAFTGGNAMRLGRFLSALGRARVVTGEFDAAEANLSEGHAILIEAKGATERDRTEVFQGLVELYDAWQKAEPDKGYDAKAAEWRAKLQISRASTQPTTSE